MLNKLRVITLLKFVDRILFIRIKLKQIELLKEKFLVDLEMGNKVYINSDMHNGNLPYSYQFYDYI